MYSSNHAEGDWSIRLYQNWGSITCCRAEVSPICSQQFWVRMISLIQPSKHLLSVLKTAFCRIISSLVHLLTILQYFWNAFPYLSYFFWLHIPFLHTSNSPFHNTLSEILIAQYKHRSKKNLTRQREQREISLTEILCITKFTLFNLLQLVFLFWQVFNQLISSPCNSL